MFVGEQMPSPLTSDDENEEMLELTEQQFIELLVDSFSEPISIPKDSTVDDLKNIISQLKNIVVDSFIIYYKDKELQNTEKLSDFDLSDHFTIVNLDKEEVTELDSFVEKYIFFFVCV